MLCLPAVICNRRYLLKAENHRLHDAPSKRESMWHGVQKVVDKWSRVKLFLIPTHRHHEQHHHHIISYQNHTPVSYHHDIIITLNFLSVFPWCLIAKLLPTILCGSCAVDQMERLVDVEVIKWAQSNHPMRMFVRFVFVLLERRLKIFWGTWGSYVDRCFRSIFRCFTSSDAFGDACGCLWWVLWNGYNGCDCWILAYLYRDLFMVLLSKELFNVHGLRGASLTSPWIGRQNIYRKSSTRYSLNQF